MADTISTLGAIFLARLSSAKVEKPKSCASSARRDEDLCDQRSVIPLARRGSRDVGPIHLLAQVAAAAVLHEGAEAREFEREPPWAGFLGPGRLPVFEHRVMRVRSQPQQARRQSFDVGPIGERDRKSLRRVEHVIGKVGRQLGHFLRDGVEPLPLFSTETDAGQLGVENLVLDDPPLWTSQRRPGRAFLESFEGAINRLALTDAEAERHNLWQHLLVRSAQFGRIEHTQQMRHRAP